MQLDRMTMAKARLAIRVAVAEFLFDPDRKINMIDVGMPVKDGQHIEDALAIRFHVSQLANKARLEAAGNRNRADARFCARGGRHHGASARGGGSR